MRESQLVYKRNDNRWEARYKKGVSASGKTLYGSVYGQTKEDALKRRETLLLEIARRESEQSSELNLLILGAGTHGRDVMEIAESLHIFRKISFLDDNIEGENIVGRCEDVSSFRKEYPCAFVAIGNNMIRRKYTQILSDCYFLIPSIVSPDASVSPKAKIGKGVAILPQARVGEAEIKDFCILSSNSLVNSDAVVGSFSHIDCGGIVLKGDCVPDDTQVKCGGIFRS